MKKLTLAKSIGLALTLLFAACKPSDTPTSVKPVNLQGNAAPIVHGGWRKMGDFFNENATVTYLFSLNGKGYYRVDMLEQTLESNFWEYDPSTNKFTSKAMLPGDYSKKGYTYFGCLAMSINNIGYYGLGYAYPIGTENLGGAIWAYDPNANTWARKADFPVKDVSFPGSFVIGADAYVQGYQNSSGVRVGMNLYKYSQASDTWTDLGTSYPVSPSNSTRLQFGIKGKGYLFSINDVDKNSDIIEFDPASGNFIFPQKASFPYQYEPQTSYILHDMIYLYCGGKNYNFYTNTNEIWRYDPVRDKWEQQPDFGGLIRHNSSAFATGDKAYIGFGQSGTTTCLDIWEYNP